MTEQTTPEVAAIDPAVIEALRKQITDQVLEQLSEKDEVERQRRIREREQNRKAREAYLDRMKQSSEPWVEIIGIEPTDQGIRTELDWNDAFIEYLKAEGITGSDDEQIIQHYVALLMQDMVSRMEEVAEDPSEFS